MADVIAPAEFALHFGTGGIRAIMGEGPDHLNEGTVAVVTQALADFLAAREERPTVAIARDCREHGREFATVATEVLLGNGVHVIDLGIAPTPMLSFAIRRLGCSAGIVLTASHNAREYNGYKVYGPDGCQATTSICQEIAAAIDHVQDIHTLPGAIAARCDDIGEHYVSALLANACGKRAEGMRVSYTPLNGTGSEYVPWALGIDGVDVRVVPEQAGLDGKFPTCPYPNPEDSDAMRRVEDLALAEGCTLALATDPDADRVGVSVLHGGAMVRLSGDEVGELLLDWACNVMAETGMRREGLVVVSTIVTSAALDVICSHWGLELRRTLTGFKFVGEQVGKLENCGRVHDFLMGIEESLGYLSGSYVRDKDGVQACVLVCRMAAWHADRGKDLVEALEGLRNTVGWNIKSQVSVPFANLKEMSCLMSELRASALAEIAATPTCRAIDYLACVPMPGDSTQTLPPSDVLQWDLADGSKLIIRPSGTEPKIKAYCFAHGKDEESAREQLTKLEIAAKALLV